MALQSNQVTPFLNVCDRVEVLGEVVHDHEGVMNMECFDALTDEAYPCLEQFFKDIKRDMEDHADGNPINVIGVKAEMNDYQVTFTVEHDDHSTKPYSYTFAEPEIL